MTNKSKFGLTAGLMGALVLLLGGLNTTALILLLVAVAVWEENEFVKVCAKRVAFIYLIYHIPYYAFDVLHDIFFSKGSFYATDFGSALNTIHSYVWTYLYIVYMAVIVILAVCAIISPSVKITLVDKLMDGVTKKAAEVSAPKATAPAAPAANTKTCPKCGKAVAEDAAFCTGCGHNFNEQ